MVRIMLTVLYCVLSTCVPFGVGADHQADGAMGVDMIGAVLGVVLDDEDGGFAAKICCVLTASTSWPRARSLLATQAAG